MTNIGKENIIRKIEGSGLLDDCKGAEEYVVSLIRKDIESQKYQTDRMEK